MGRLALFSPCGRDGRASASEGKGVGFGEGEGLFTAIGDCERSHPVIFKGSTMQITSVVEAPVQFGHPLKSFGLP